MKVADTHPDCEALGFPGDRVRYVCKKYEKDATLIYGISEVIVWSCICEQKLGLLNQETTKSLQIFDSRDKYPISSLDPLKYVLNANHSAERNGYRKKRGTFISDPCSTRHT